MDMKVEACVTERLPDDSGVDNLAVEQDRKASTNAVEFLNMLVTMSKSFLFNFF